MLFVDYGPGVVPFVTPAERDFYGEFEWLQPLAEGGMGTVYLAEAKQHNNARCVIKQLRSDPNRSEEELEEARRLFLREVEILRNLDHAGIVPFRDWHVTNDGRYFLVMDYITGNNLETTIQSYGPFNEDDAVKVGIQICEVLEYLHEDQSPEKPSIIYRDLKPSNLMLTPEGQVIFIDFGIARVLMPSTTATRVVTAGYSPPEQYFGKPEVRSDLYALGATLAHLVTGNPFMPPGSPREWQPITTRGVGRKEDRPELIREIHEHVVAVRDLIVAVDEGREPVCGLEEGAGTVEMICAVFESHRQGGRAVAFPLGERGHPLERMREEGQK